MSFLPALCFYWLHLYFQLGWVNLALWIEKTNYLVEAISTQVHLLLYLSFLSCCSAFWCFVLRESAWCTDCTTCAISCTTCVLHKENHPQKAVNPSDRSSCIRDSCPAWFSLLPKKHSHKILNFLLLCSKEGKGSLMGHWLVWSTQGRASCIEENDLPQHMKLLGLGAVNRFYQRQFWKQMLLQCPDIQNCLWSCVILV